MNVGIAVVIAVVIVALIVVALSHSGGDPV